MLLSILGSTHWESTSLPVVYSQSIWSYSDWSSYSMPVSWERIFRVYQGYSIAWVCLLIPTKSFGLVALSILGSRAEHFFLDYHWQAHSWSSWNTQPLSKIYWTALRMYSPMCCSLEDWRRIVFVSSYRIAYSSGTSSSMLGSEHISRTHCCSQGV